MSQFDFVGLTRINVVILPINIDDGDFLRYSNIIKRYPSVNLCDTARPRTRWKAGRVAFSYHLYRADQPVPPVTTLSTSSSSSSPTPSGTDNNSNSNNSYVGNLFWSQRVIAVMGVARCGGTAADVTALYSAFNAAAAAYPSAICKTLFVVDPPAAQFALDSRENIVFGYSEDAKLMETIVQSHLVAGTAQAILIAYEHDVYSSTSASTASDPSPTTSPTPSSSSSFSSSFPSSTPYAPLPPSAVPSVITTGIDYSRRGDAKQRGKRGHRQQKRRGDLALQAGQWDLALSMYAQAADDARGAGDWEWAGAALEGQCAALIAKAGLPRNAKACEDDVMRRAAEALALYAKRVAVLEGEGSGALAALCRAVWAELALYVRVARFKATIAGAKEAAAEWLTNAHACGAKAFADLPLERARLWGALAAVYREIGFRRKFAFYAWLAAGALTEASRGDRSDREMAAVAHRVLEDAGRELGLGLLLGRTHDRGFAGHKKANFWGGIAVPFTFGGWEALQVPALVELIGLARQMGDHRLTAAYSMYALANYTAALPQEAQEDLALEVIKAAATAGHPVDVSGVVLPVPSVLKINPIPATGNYTLVPPKVASSGPFIYTPTVLK